LQAKQKRTAPRHWCITPSSRKTCVLKWGGSAPNAEKLRYPDGFHHVIEMPQRVMQVMNRIDREAGQRFDDAIRGMANTMRPQAPAGLPPTNPQKP
jgi:hypothetical protein